MGSRNLRLLAIIKAELEAHGAAERGARRARREQFPKYPVTKWTSDKNGDWHYKTFSNRQEMENARAVRERLQELKAEQQREDQPKQSSNEKTNSHGVTPVHSM